MQHETTYNHLQTARHGAGEPEQAHALLIVGGGRGGLAQRGLHAAQQAPLDAEALHAGARHQTVSARSLPPGQGKTSACTAQLARLLMAPTATAVSQTMHTSPNNAGGRATLLR